MIEINLLPDGLRKTQKKKNTQKVNLSDLPLKNIAIAAVAMFVLFQIFASLVLLKKSATLKRLNKEIKKLDLDYAIAQSLKKDQAQLRGKLAAINELTLKSILWSKKLYDLSGATTEGIWLKELSLSEGREDPNQQIMVLKGSAVSQPLGEETALIGNFINSLKSSKGFFDDFTSIKLKSSRIKKLKDLEVMDFTVSCYFKPGRIYFDKPKR